MGHSVGVLRVDCVMCATCRWLPLGPSSSCGAHGASGVVVCGDADGGAAAGPPHLSTPPSAISTPPFPIDHCRTNRLFCPPIGSIYPGHCQKGKQFIQVISQMSSKLFISLVVFNSGNWSPNSAFSYRKNKGSDFASSVRPDSRTNRSMARGFKTQKLCNWIVITALKLT